MKSMLLAPVFAVALMGVTGDGRGAGHMRARRLPASR